MKHATDNEIFHRDIKPTNIIVHGNNGYLIDWGIATINSLVNNDTLSARRARWTQAMPPASASGKIRSRRAALLSNMHRGAALKSGKLANENLTTLANSMNTPSII